MRESYRARLDLSKHVIGWWVCLRMRVAARGCRPRWAPCNIFCLAGQPLTMDKTPALTPMLFQERNALHHHAPVHGFAHVVDGEQGHLHSGEGFHLHASGADGFNRGGAASKRTKYLRLSQITACWWDRIGTRICPGSMISVQAKEQYHFPVSH